MKQKQRCDCGKFMKKKKVKRLNDRGADEKYAIAFKCLHCGASRILNFLKDWVGKGTFRWQRA